MRKIRNDDRVYCENCSYLAGKDDKFCRKCGTKIGGGRYVPQNDIMQCIYGPPPVTRQHICQSCGYSWSTMFMIDYEKKCPKCGGNAPYNEEPDECIL